MKYKMIVSDFDDTLNDSKNHEYKASQRTLDAINAYRQKGGVFCINTGRSFSSLRNCLPMYGMDKFDTLVVCNQGASCYSSVSQKVVFEQNIDRQAALRLMEFIQSQGLYANVYFDDVCYMEYIIDWLQEWLDRDAGDFSWVKVQNIMQTFLSIEKPPQKFSILDSEENIAKLQKQLIVQFPEMQFCTSNPKLLEASSALAGKGNMTIKLAQHLNIPMSQVVCIGDSQNDVSMLKVAGLAVAVDNAFDYVKKEAHYITEAVWNDGVAQVLEKIMDGSI